MNIKEIQLLHDGDWTGIYVDGKLEVSDLFVSARHIIHLFDPTIKVVNISLEDAQGIDNRHTEDIFKDGIPKEWPMLVEAPWTPEQVENANKWQQRPDFHPFTCRDCGTSLVAESHGWECEKCRHHIQNWAHDFQLCEPPPLDSFYGDKS